jgi:hypothetical protein
VDEKRCKRCGELKSTDDFYANPKGAGGLRPECKTCTRAYRSAWYAENASAEVARVKAWQQANVERVNAGQRKRRQDPARKLKERDAYLRRKYGIGLEEYDAKLAEQDGCCAICRREPRSDISLHVDHDHVTGKIRGLLCFRCNVAIGLISEDHDSLRAIADYLDGHDPEVAELHAMARVRVEALKQSA